MPVEESHGWRFRYKTFSLTNSSSTLFKILAYGTNISLNKISPYRLNTMHVFVVTQETIFTDPGLSHLFLFMFSFLMDLKTNTTEGRLLCYAFKTQDGSCESLPACKDVLQVIPCF